MIDHIIMLYTLCHLANTDYLGTLMQGQLNLVVTPQEASDYMHYNASDGRESRGISVGDIVVSVVVVYNKKI